VKQPATGTAIHQIVQKLHNSYQSSLRGDGRRLLQGVACDPKSDAQGGGIVYRPAWPHRLPHYTS
jgi:hypothetical protein